MKNKFLSLLILIIGIVAIFVSPVFYILSNLRTFVFS